MNIVKIIRYRLKHEGGRPLVLLQQSTATVRSEMRRSKLLGARHVRLNDEPVDELLSMVFDIKIVLTCRMEKPREELVLVVNGAEEAIRRVLVVLHQERLAPIFCEIGSLDLVPRKSTLKYILITHGEIHQTEENTNLRVWCSQDDRRANRRRVADWQGSTRSSSERDSKLATGEQRR